MDIYSITIEDHIDNSMVTSRQSEVEFKRQKIKISRDFSGHGGLNTGYNIKGNPGKIPGKSIPNYHPGEMI